VENHSDAFLAEFEFTRDGELKPIETVRGRGYRFAIPRSE
jgi:DNA-binding winged helix-turn-helix (wHTH) protein